MGHLLHRSWIPPQQHSLWASPPRTHLPETQHTDTHAPYLGEGSPWKEPPGPLSSSGGPSPGPRPCSGASPVSSLPPALFLTQPPAPQSQRKLHNPLGAANVAKDYSQRPPEGLPHPQVYPMRRDSPLQSHPPRCPGTGSVPASSQPEAHTGLPGPRPHCPWTKMGRHPWPGRLRWLEHCPVHQRVTVRSLVRAASQGAVICHLPLSLAGFLGPL